MMIYNLYSRFDDGDGYTQFDHHGTFTTEERARDAAARSMDSITAPDVLEVHVETRHEATNNYSMNHLPIRNGQRRWWVIEIARLDEASEASGVPRPSETRSAG